MNRSISIIIIVILSLFLVACSKSKIDVAGVIGTDKMSIERYNASFIIDPDNLSEVTTLSTYVFVGQVEKYEKTEYINGENDSPVTYYSVKVIENIKGKLTQNENVTLSKAGGLRKNTNTFLVCNEDILPHENGLYIFCATIYNDELYCFAPNMVASLDDINNYKEENTYKKYITALETIVEDIPNETDVKSRYDIGK